MLRKDQLFVIGIAVAVLGASGVSLFRPHAQTAGQSRLENFRPTGPAERPHIEITSDHQLARVQHKDASGLSPLETIVTPNGPLTVQRTFAATGKLLKEEAFLNGKSVPVPQR